MSGSCHLDRVLKFEIGDEYNIIVIGRVICTTVTNQLLKIDCLQRKEAASSSNPRNRESSVPKVPGLLANTTSRDLLSKFKTRARELGFLSAILKKK